RALGPAALGRRPGPDARRQRTRAPPAPPILKRRRSGPRRTAPIAAFNQLPEIAMPNAKVADFSAPSPAGTFRLSAHRGHTVILYFYPKDNTPGCTTEGANFRDLHKAFV